jgi:hypothetical protein
MINVASGSLRRRVREPPVLAVRLARATSTTPSTKTNFTGIHNLLTCQRKYRKPAQSIIGATENCLFNFIQPYVVHKISL